ncbi:MAG: hypothetical protein D084_Lepto4C00330G0001 [Leptospirillum sp. Group IV 'UBA BS']|nr:MAG: hypothetical protein D084_Lepto4C00330G0001 [Leptospirillum sp. Group IV 'UBA BS']
MTGIQEGGNGGDGREGPKRVRAGEKFLVPAYREHWPCQRGSGVDVSISPVLFRRIWESEFRMKGKKESEVAQRQILSVREGGPFVIGIKESG